MLDEHFHPTTPIQTRGRIAHTFYIYMLPMLNVVQMYIQTYTLSYIFYLIRTKPLIVRNETMGCTPRVLERVAR